RRMAPEERVEAHRVGVNRYRQHVCAFVENFLGAVAVMHIDVEDRDAVVSRAQDFRADGAVVQVTEAACEILRRMVPRRTRECVAGAVAAEYFLCPLYCGHRAPARAFPGV